MATNGAASPGLIARWARFASRHPWRVLAGWLVIFVVAGVLSSTVGGKFVDSFKIPGAESQKAVDLLSQRFPSQSGDAATIVVKAGAGVNDPATRQRIQAIVASAKTLPEVVGAVSPFDASGAISTDGKFALIRVQYDRQANDIQLASAKKLVALVDASGGNGLAVEAGGQIVAVTENSFGGTSELIGLAAAVVILIVAFGSVVAMGVPILAALVGLGLGIVFTLIAARFFDMSSFTISFLSMIGLGVGIDYSLFIVTRFREGLHNGDAVEDAIVRAVDTSGRATIFAGTVVAIALLGLLAIGIPFVAALGIAAALVVVSAVFVAIGFTPAVLRLIGTRIDKLKVPGLSDGHDPEQKGVWFRWTGHIQKRPWLFGGMALIALLVLAIPFFSMRIGSSDDGNSPASLHTRRAYDLLAAGFGPGFNGPLVIVVTHDGGLAQTALDSVESALKADSGIAAVGPAVLNQAGDTAVIQVTPKFAPQAQETSNLVKNLRDNVLPPAVVGSGVTAYVGGATAAFIDIGDKITSRLPLFFMVVIGLSILVLMMVFRSIVIPIKAAIFNLLSIGAAYGVLVAVFQWGWLGGLFGVEKKGPIESFLPMMLFAILFGLAMDYEVFLLSRIHESICTGKPRTTQFELDSD